MEDCIKVSGQPQKVNLNILIKVDKQKNKQEGSCGDTGQAKPAPAQPCCQTLPCGCVVVYDNPCCPPPCCGDFHQPGAAAYYPEKSEKPKKKKRNKASKQKVPESCTSMQSTQTVASSIAKSKQSQMQNPAPGKCYERSCQTFESAMEPAGGVSASTSTSRMNIGMSCHSRAKPPVGQKSAKEVKGSQTGAEGGGSRGAPAKSGGVAPSPAGYQPYPETKQARKDPSVKTVYPAQQSGEGGGTASTRESGTALAQTQSEGTVASSKQAEKNQAKSPTSAKSPSPRADGTDTGPSSTPNSAKATKQMQNTPDSTDPAKALKHGDMPDPIAPPKSANRNMQNIPDSTGPTNASTQKNKPGAEASTKQDKPSSSSPTSSPKQDKPDSSAPTYSSAPNKPKTAAPGTTTAMNSNQGKSGPESASPRSQPPPNSYSTTNLGATNWDPSNNGTTSPTIFLGYFDQSQDTASIAKILNTAEGEFADNQQRLDENVRRSFGSDDAEDYRAPLPPRQFSKHVFSKSGLNLETIHEDEPTETPFQSFIEEVGGNEDEYGEYEEDAEDGGEYCGPCHNPDHLYGGEPCDCDCPEECPHECDEECDEEPELELCNVDFCAESRANLGMIGWGWDTWDRFVCLLNGEPYPDSCNPCMNRVNDYAEGPLQVMGGGNEAAGGPVAERGLLFREDPYYQETYVILVALPLLLLGLMAGFRGC